MSLSLRTLIDNTYMAGRYWYSTFRRVSPIASVSGYWVDLSMATGIPIPNYYTGNPLEATVPANWYKKSIFHGGAVSPYKKYLHKISIYANNAVLAPAPFILCDYLMYYPLIDMDSTDVQLFSNTSDDPTVSSLPRYTDGIGVSAFLVATNPYVGGASFQITYTNTLNQVNTSQITVTNTSTYIATLVNSNTAGLLNHGAFIDLQAGDIGMKKINSIQFTAPNGGLGCLVMVRPIATMMTKETTAWCEFDFIKDKPSMPRIYDGAYLNFLTMPSGSIATIPVMGEMAVIWDT